MSFCWCTITVKNMAESLQFYQEIVGLPVARRHAGGAGTEIVFLGNGETQVELISHEGNPGGQIGTDLSLGFTVPNLDEKIAFIRQKGIAIQAGPIQPNPAIRFFYVLDPNGLRIQFVENIR